MNISQMCSNYFNPIQDLAQPKNKTANLIGVLKIVSYFTVILPLVFGVAYGVASLCGRCSIKSTQNPREKAVRDLAAKTLFSSPDTTDPVVASREAGSAASPTPTAQQIAVADRLTAIQVGSTNVQASTDNRLMPLSDEAIPSDYSVVPLSDKATENGILDSAGPPPSLAQLRPSAPSSLGDATAPTPPNLASAAAVTALEPPLAETRAARLAAIKIESAKIMQADQDAEALANRAIADFRKGNTPAAEMILQQLEGIYTEAATAIEAGQRLYQDKSETDIFAYLDNMSVYLGYLYDDLQRVRDALAPADAPTA